MYFTSFNIAGVEIELPLDLTGPPYNLPHRVTVRVMLSMITGDMPALYELLFYRFGICFKCPDTVPCMLMDVRSEMMESVEGGERIR